MIGRIYSPLLFCVRCQRPVELMEYVIEQSDTLETFYVKCHGDYRTFRFRFSDFTQASGERMRVDVFKEFEASEVPPPTQIASSNTSRRFNFEL